MADKTDAKQRRLPSAFTILAMLAIFVAALTWIVPAGRYDTKTVETSAGEKEVAVKGTYKTAAERVKKAQEKYDKVMSEQGINDPKSDKAKENTAFKEASEELEAAKKIRDPQGIWEVLMSPIKGIKEVVEIIIVVMFVGGLLALEAKVGAIQAGFRVLMTKMKGKEIILIPILITLFAICGSTYGSQEETVVYYAFMVPLMLAAGYNAMTALLTVIVGTTVGIAASTVNPFSAMIAAEVGGTTVGNGMLLRVIMLVVGIVIGSFFVMRYAKKVKAGEYKEDSANDKKLTFGKTDNNGGEFDAKRKAVLVIIFMALIVITILAFIPWEAVLKITFFSDVSKWVAGLPIVGELIGNVTPFGEWYFNELGVLYLVSALLIGWMYKIGDHEFVDTFIEGAKDVLGVCLIIGVARGITVLMNDGNITHTILHSLESLMSNLPEGLVKGLFGGVLYILFLPLAFLIPSTSGLASVAMPIFGQLAQLTGVGVSIAVAAFVAGSGIIQMIAPTVASLMGGTVACGISYSKYLKRIAGLFIALSVAYIVIITISALTGIGA